MNEYERFFIKRYDTLCKNNKGYNIASGGSNGNPLEGKTEEEIEQWKQKLSEAHKGKIFSEEHKQKMSEAKKGKNHPQSKRVAQYDKQGNLIKIWDYVKQVEEELGIHHSNICKCCKDKQKSAGGYIWRYAEETE